MFTYKDQCDKRLVELTLCGDGRAFEELVLRYEKAVLGTAYKITRDRYSAEDIAQEAFVAAWLQLERLSSQEKFASYVCAIAKNQAKNMIMRESRIAKTVSFTDFENKEFDSIDPLDECDEIYEQLYDNIELLSEVIGETVKLYYFEGLSVKNISVRLGIP